MWLGHTHTKKKKGGFYLFVKHMFNCSTHFNTQAMRGCKSVFFLSSITHAEPQLFEPCLFFQRKEYLKEKWRHRNVWNTPEGVQQDQLAKGNRARQFKRITGSLKQILSLQPVVAAPGLKIPSSHQGHAITHFRCISTCFRLKPP